MGGLIRCCYLKRILPCGAKLVELVQADLTQGVYVLLSLFALGGDGLVFISSGIFFTPWVYVNCAFFTLTLQC